ncbi:hypothetical protein LY78DRAFT_684555 [Colletotrichum sublineola]|nr:hypothetical protein LY78DRAFT_684555 [Colletotrichum sublineola]
MFIYIATSTYSDAPRKGVVQNAQDSMSTLAILATATSEALREACVQDEPSVWIIGDISAALLTAARLLGPPPLVRFVEGTRLLPTTAGRKQYVDPIVDGLCLPEETAGVPAVVIAMSAILLDINGMQGAQSQLRGVVDEKTEEAMRLFGEWLDPSNTLPGQDIFRLYPVLTGVILMSTLETRRQLSREHDSDAQPTDSACPDAETSQPLEKPPSITGMLVQGNCRVAQLIRALQRVLQEELGAFNGI